MSSLKYNTFQTNTIYMLFAAILYRDPIFRLHISSQNINLIAVNKMDHLLTLLWSPGGAMRKIIIEPR